MTRNERKQFFVADNLKAVAVSLLSVSLITLLLGILMFAVIRGQEEARARDILDSVRAIFQDAERTIDYLNTTPVLWKTCRKCAKPYFALAL